jgi:hypothetical protein
VKPLLKPRHRPDPRSSQLRVLLDRRDTGVADTMHRIESAMRAICLELTKVLGHIELEVFDPVEDDTSKFNWWHYRTSKRRWIGSLNLTPLLHGGFRNVSVEMPYSTIGKRWHLAVELADILYSSLGPRVMYVFDADDEYVQNAEDAGEVTMEMAGIVRGLVEIVEIEGGIERIDTRANPGYMTWWKGYCCSVQWLNYWSKEAIAAMFMDFPTRPMEGVDLTFLPDGAARLRLGEKPGKYNDVKFHELQLRVREWLGWHPSMWKLGRNQDDPPRT